MRDPLGENYAISIRVSFLSPVMYRYTYPREFSFIASVVEAADTVFSVCIIVVFDESKAGYELVQVHS